MKLRYVAAVLATTAFAAPALALPTSGPRVEAVLGYDHVNSDLGDFGLDDESAGGVLYGVGVGYDFAVGPNASFGVDAELSDSTTDIEFTDGDDTAKIAAGRDIYVGARVTGAVASNVNLYGKLGYTNARIKASAEQGGTEILSEAANADGLRAGIGAQFGLGPNSFVGTEYRYSNYEGGLSRHQVAGTVGFRF